MDEHLVKTLETQNRELIGFLAQARESRDHWKNKYEAVFIDYRILARRLDKVKALLAELTV